MTRPLLTVSIGHMRQFITPRPISCQLFVADPEQEKPPQLYACFLAAFISAYMKINRLRAYVYVPQPARACARLLESISEGIADILGCVLNGKNGVITSLKTANTLHRFLHDCQQNRTPPVDIILIDEVSMVDAAMFAAVSENIPKHAQCIFLGDLISSQLYSPEPCWLPALTLKTVAINQNG